MKCPGCGTTSKKKLRVEIVGKSFNATCDCGYMHKTNKKERIIKMRFLTEEEVWNLVFFALGIIVGGVIWGIN